MKWRLAVLAGTQEECHLLRSSLERLSQREEEYRQMYTRIAVAAVCVFFVSLRAVCVMCPLSVRDLQERVDELAKERPLRIPLSPLSLVGEAHSTPAASAAPTPTRAIGPPPLTSPATGALPHGLSTDSFVGLYRKQRYPSGALTSFIGGTTCCSKLRFSLLRC